MIDLPLCRADVIEEPTSPQMRRLPPVSWFAMRWLPDSPRRRKRVVFLVVLTAGGVLAAVLGMHFTNTAHPEKETFRPGKAQVVREQKPIRLSAAERRAVLAAVDRFVDAAVARHDLAAAFDMTTRNLRGPLSRAQWAKGDIPVYPYPISEHSERIQAAYRGDVMVQLLLKARRRAKVEPLDVDVELKAAGKGRSRRWLVDYYLPRETVGTAADRRASGPAPKDPGIGPHLTMAWLLVPAGVFLLIVLLPVALGVRHWLAGRAAERQYAGERKLPPLPAPRQRER
jgi:hypothetical protein